MKKLFLSPVWLVFATLAVAVMPAFAQYGTYIGTARTVKSPNGGGSVLYEQSVCAEGSATCLSDGTNTFGDLVMYTLKGGTLDQLTTLQTDYYVQSGCFGGGSPRFQISVSNGTDTENIFVYLGATPSFTDCPTLNSWASTGNLATDDAGNRWDTSQISTCPASYTTYSAAVTCADAAGYTINAIFLITDGGWSGTNAGTSTGQTFLFRNIQINQDIKFPRTS